MSHKSVRASIFLTFTCMFATAAALPRVAHSVPTTHQGTAASTHLDQLTRIVRTSSHNDALHVLSTFSGPAGLTGLVITNGAGGKQIAWLTVDRSVLIPGPIYNTTGADLTRAAMYAQGVYEQPARAIEQAALPASRAIMVGRRGPRLTFFFDPNCIYCHALYGELQAPIAAGKLRVRYVLVGVVKPTSAARAAAILAAPDPAGALVQNERDFDVAHEEGGFAIPTTKDGAAAVAVQANSALMARVGSNGTPTLLYCDASTGHVVMKQGVPASVSALIQALGTTGSPACH